MAGVALPDSILGKIGDFLGAAMWASNHAIGPAKFHHDSFAVLKITEVDDRFLKSLDALHETIMRLFAWYVKYIITINCIVTGVLTIWTFLHQSTPGP